MGRKLRHSSLQNGKSSPSSTCLGIGVALQDGQFLGLYFVTFENLGASLQKLSFPLADLVGMDFKFLSKF